MKAAHVADAFLSILDPDAPWARRTAVEDYDLAFHRGLRRAAAGEAGRNPADWGRYRRIRRPRRIAWLVVLLGGAIFCAMLPVAASYILWVACRVEWAPSPASITRIAFWNVCLAVLFAFLMSGLPRGPALVASWSLFPVSNRWIYRRERGVMLRYFVCMPAVLSLFLACVFLAMNGGRLFLTDARSVTWALACALLQAACIHTGAQVLAHPGVEPRKGALFLLYIALAVLALAVHPWLPDAAMSGPWGRRAMLAIPLHWPAHAFLNAPNGPVGPADAAPIAAAALLSGLGATLARNARRRFERVDLRALNERELVAPRPTPVNPAALEARLATGRFLTDEECLGPMPARWLDRASVRRLTRREWLLRWALRGIRLDEGVARMFTGSSLIGIAALALVLLPGCLWAPGVLVGGFLLLLVFASMFWDLSGPRAGRQGGARVRVFALYPIGLREVAEARRKESLPFHAVGVLVIALGCAFAAGIDRESPLQTFASLTGLRIFAGALVAGSAIVVIVRVMGVLGMIEGDSGPGRRYNLATIMVGALGLAGIVAVLFAPELPRLASAGGLAYVLALILGWRLARAAEKARFDWVCRSDHIVENADGEGGSNAPPTV